MFIYPYRAILNLKHKISLKKLNKPLIDILRDVNNSELL